MRKSIDGLSQLVEPPLSVDAFSGIFAHNHPSGVAESSHADELLTQSRKQALALMDKPPDHFIVAGNAAIDGRAGFAVEGGYGGDKPRKPLHASCLKVEYETAYTKAKRAERRVFTCY